MTTTNFTNGSTLSDAGWADDTDTLVYGVLSSVAGTNTITAGGPASMTAYASGQRFWLIPANTTTGATTLNITPSGGSALGAKNIFSNGAALISGEIVQNVPIELFYDGTQFNIIGNPPAVGTTATTFTFDGSGGTTAEKTLTWVKRGNWVTLSIPTVTGTSGTSSINLISDTALPTGIRPVADQSQPINNIIDNDIGVSPGGLISITTAGVVHIVKNQAGTAFTNSSTCGIGASGSSVTYFIG